MAEYNQFFKKINGYVVILILIAIITHIEWFNLKSLLFFHDWRYLPDSAVREFFTDLSRTTWIHWYGFGSANIQNYMFPFFYLWGLIGSFSLGTKILFLWPISILSVLAPYYLLKYLRFEDRVSFLGSLMFAFNTYLIMRTNVHLTIAVVNVLTPLIILYFLKFKDNPNLKNGSIFLFLLTVGIIYEFRIMLIVFFTLFIIGLFTLPNKVNRRLLKSAFIIIVLLLLLNSFWILPTLFSDKTQISSVINRNLWGEELFDLNHALALSEYHWTGGKYNQEFILTPIKTYLWLIPIICFISLVILKKDNSSERREMIFVFSIVTLSGILLVKFVSAPFPNLYPWLYNTFLGFNIYREPSKFYLMISIGYLMLFSYSLNYLFKYIKNNLKRNIFFAFILVVLLINTIPLATKEIGGLYVSQKEPQEYKELQNLFLNDTDYHYRTLWVPMYHQFGYFNLLRPKVSLWTTDFSTLQSPFNNLTNMRADLSNFKNPKLYSSVFLREDGKSIIDGLNIKYIIIPTEQPESVERIFPYAGKREDYIAEFDKIKYLERADIGNLVIYENKNYSPLFYLSNSVRLSEKPNLNKNVEFRLINPTKYSVEIKNLSSKYYLNFAETYNKDWKLKLNKAEDVSNDFHITNDLLINIWTIDPQYIKDNYHKEYYKENPDVSIDVEMVLYFKPQSYFYLGLLISGTTLITCIGYLIYDWKRNRNKNRECGAHI